MTNSTTNIIIIIESCQNFFRWGFAIKKPVVRGTYGAIFIILVVLSLAFVFVSCKDFALLGERGDPDAPDVRWTEDWKFITVYLDESYLLPKPKYTYYEKSEDEEAAGRAMTADTARMGYSFFEVFFYCDGRIEHTAWEIGKRALVTTVYRTDSGVDYSGTSVPNTGIAGAAGQAALIFAGRKNDKTLLAVGKVYSVDDVPGTIIKSDSSYVTFQLFALTGGVSYEPKYSSFLTAYDTSRPVGADNTLTMEADIGGRRFPLYKLPQGKAAVNAEYTFKLDGAEWEEFAGSVLVAEVYDDSAGGTECGSVTLRNPRYPAGDGVYWYAVYPMDITTTARMMNNQMKGRPVENRIRIEINTSNSTEKKLGKDGIGMFTLGFRIPVVPLMEAKETGFISPMESVLNDDYTDPGVTWFIRPAYQSYYYNIDNAVDSTGGGALMGFFSEATKRKYFDRRKI